jgi:hypothetical protein
LLSKKVAYALAVLGATNPMFASAVVGLILLINGMRPFHLTPNKILLHKIVGLVTTSVKLHLGSIKIKPHLALIEAAVHSFKTCDKF